MQIKFANLLQDSWNFMRNQTNFSLIAISCLIVLQLILLLFAPATTKVNAEQVQQVELNNLLSGFLPTIMLALANLLISLLVILNIKSINDGEYKQFFQNLNAALKAFLPALALTVLMVLPFSVAVSSAIVSPSLSIIALPILITGIYIFIKMSLALYAYILEKPQMSVSQTVSFLWRLSKGKMLPLVLFCLISHIVPLILSRWIAMLGSSVAVQTISIIFSAAISIFISVFSFRFYQVYRQLPANN